MALVETKIVTRIDGKKVGRTVHIDNVSDASSGAQHLDKVQRSFSELVTKARKTLSI